MSAIVAPIATAPPRHAISRGGEVIAPDVDELLALAGLSAPPAGSPASEQARRAAVSTIAAAGKPRWPSVLPAARRATISFLETAAPRVLVAERLAVGTLRGQEWAGTLDLIVEIAGERWLFDVRVGHQPCSVPSDPLRLAALRNATALATVDASGAVTRLERVPERIEHCGLLLLGEDGEWDLEEVEVGDAAWRRFRELRRQVAVEAVGGEDGGELDELARWEQSSLF